MKLSASNADVAHLVERNLAKVEVASSSLVIRSISSFFTYLSSADVAHLVERNLAKVEVASSSLVIRSIIAPTHCVGVYFFAIADMPQLLRQYCTKIVPQMRTDVCRGIFVQDDGKYASRCGAKPQGGLCAVLPYVPVPLTSIQNPL